MADLHAWRNAATELPPEGVPVVAMLDGGPPGWFEVSRDDDGATIWVGSEGLAWVDGAWEAMATFYEGDPVVRYWHPLPDVPTLAELDAAHGAGPAADAASEGGVE